MIADDIFAGAGGWDLAAQALGIHARGIENMPAARETREAAGLTTIHDDVWTFTPDGRATGLIASPPCQTFSAAGKGSGRKALDDVLAVIESGDWHSLAKLKEAGLRFGDDRTALVLTPLHFATGYEYEWLAWEQVPAVLPVWEACAEVLRELGWHVWTGLLQAEMYGVPQTRKRAFLLASLNGPVEPPTPTHSRYYSRSPEKLDEGVQKWVSMAEALGWGLVPRPSFTITGGSSHAASGIEWGGAGARSAIASAAESGDPAAWQDVEYVNGTHDHAARRPGDRPAPTVMFGNRLNKVEWVMRSNYGTGGDSTKRGERLASEPAPTVTSKIDRNQWRQASGTRPNAVTRPVDEPSVTLAFGNDAASYVFVPESVPVAELPDAKRRGDAIRVTVAEAGVLQSFPAAYPWQGTRGKQYLQCGNAVPPLLAFHALGAAAVHHLAAIEEVA